MAVRRVADASAVIALFFGEPEAPIARRLLQGFELFAPTLLPYELSNVATIKARRDPSLGPVCFAALTDALNSGIQTRVVDVTQAMVFAFELKISAYDAAYICIARELECALVTFDRALRTAAERAGIRALSS